jgi:nucleoside-diphosphate-sugar epimerase
VLLITGSSGLIGRYLCKRLRAAGVEFREFDLRNSPEQDIRNRTSLRAALQGITGIVHLAAVSRVIWGERDPTKCFETNVRALGDLVDLCVTGSRPWLIFASSREVYGNAARLPVQESAPLQPVNVYGRSKRDGETIVQAARERGLVANICRFSSVFGCPFDHPDRVVMAFASIAAQGGVMPVEGSGIVLDFTAVEDVADGLFRSVEAASQGCRLPPIHFVSGRGTTLRELAEMAAAHAVRRTSIEERPSRKFGVSLFVGDPSRARDLLGWRATANLADRVGMLVADLAAKETAQA